MSDRILTVPGLLSVREKHQTKVELIRKAE